ncbi:MAG: Gmad2 immunoglobulin-like domain-containing protein [bacterium]
MKTKIIITIAVIVVIVIAIIRFSSPEDTWICQDGAWVKHGEPTAPQPTSSCMVVEENSSDEVITDTTDTTPPGTDTNPPVPTTFDYKDLVKLKTPLPNSYLSSPLIVKGEARGNWFFEASFPVILVNWDGLIIAEGLAQAQGDWMTEDFVPFKAVLTFEKPDYKDNGALILKKDNPSGLPQHDDALEIPIFFK